MFTTVVIRVSFSLLTNNIQYVNDLTKRNTVVPFSFRDNPHGITRT